MKSPFLKKHTNCLDVSFSTLINCSKTTIFYRRENVRVIINILAIVLFFFSLVCNAEERNEEKPPAIGNFALSVSQQPGPLVSFGENILSAKETQLSLFADDYIGVDKHFVDLIPSVLYGITDSLSIYLNVPYALSYQLGQQKSSGIEDAFAQLEYAFYNKSTGYDLTIM